MPALERGRRINVVEDAQPRVLGEHPRGVDRIRAIGCDHRHVGVPHRGYRAAAYVRPIRIQHQLDAVDPPQIAMRRVIRDVALEEGHLMTATRERTTETSPQSGVTV